MRNARQQFLLLSLGHSLCVLSLDFGSRAGNSMAGLGGATVTGVTFPALETHHQKAYINTNLIVMRVYPSSMRVNL